MAKEYDDDESHGSGGGFELGNLFAILILIVCLAAPLVVVTAALCYALFSYVRIHHRVLIGATLALAGILAVAAVFGYNALHLFLSSYSLILDLLGGFSLDKFISITLHAMLLQLPLSLVIGGLIGSSYSWWLWFRRPEWKDYSFRKTPGQIIAKKRNIKAIQTDRNTPPDGRTLGINEDGERVNQSEREARAHTFVIGAAGSGKTTTILNGTRDLIKRGEGVVFIDMKGHPENAETLAMYAKRYGRNFYHWTSAENEETYDGPADRPAFYDPLGRGDATRKTNLLIAGRETAGSAGYFTNIAQNYIQKAFEISNAVPKQTRKVMREVPIYGDELETERQEHAKRVVEYQKKKAEYDAWVAAGKPDTRKQVAGSSEWKTRARAGEMEEPIELKPFTNTKTVEVEEEAELESFMDLITLLDPQELKKRSLALVGKSPYYDQIIAEIHLMADRKMDANTNSALESMRDQLGVLMHSVQGRWLKKDPTGDNNINIFEAAHQGDVIVFSIDSSNYPANARILGDFIIQDLKTVTSELRNDPARYPMNVIIDEFSAIGSDNIITLISKSRDAKMPVTLSTQSLGDLKAVSESFLDQVVGTITSFIIHRVNAHADAEEFASLTPKIESATLRKGVAHTTNFFGIMKARAVGKGSVDVVKTHMIDPSEIQKLKTGEAFYICKSPERLERIMVYAEPDAITSSDRRTRVSPVAQENTIPPLALNSSDDLDSYRVTHSENYRISMEEQKAEAKVSVESGSHVAKHANLSAIKRIIGEDHLREISVNKGRIEAGSTVSTAAPTTAADTATVSLPNYNSSDDRESVMFEDYPDDYDDEADDEYITTAAPTKIEHPATPAVKRGHGRMSMALPELDIDEDDYDESSIPDIFSDDK